MIRLRFPAVLAGFLWLVPLPTLAVGGLGVDHSTKISAYTGPETCMACHSKSKMRTILAQDVYNSVHFQLRTTNVSIDMPGGGSHGMLDRACGLPGTTLMAGNYAGTAINSSGGKLDDGCGKCHLSYKPPQFYTSYTDALPDIDCLICHAAVYSKAEWDDPAKQALYGTNPGAPLRAVVPLKSIPRYSGDTSGRLTWAQDRTLPTARTVGQLPRSEFCQRCHEHGLSRYKRATPFEAATDVHAAGAMECFQCHLMEKHKIARGNYVTDGTANERPTVEVGCSVSGCHLAAPHLATNAAALNKHTTNVACEACHIPQMKGANNIWERTWGPFTVDPRFIPQYASTQTPPDPATFPWESTPATKTGEYPGFWDAFSTYHDAQGATDWPSIRWFDGKASMLAQPFAGFNDRASAGGKARLFAFKPFTSGMLFDAAWLPGPPTDWNNANTWRASMRAFYEANWDRYVQFGFVGATYPTAASYWAARPDMAAMLNRFPNMLQFSRPTFLSGAGDVAGTPVPGPQTAATFPQIAAAIDLGMGTMGLEMGACGPLTDPVQCGKLFWSGSFFSMWVPVDLQGYLGSFITASHAIRGTEPGSPLLDPLFCTSCHYNADEYHKVVPPAKKRLDFAALGYPDTDQNGLTDPRAEPSVVPTISGVTMAFASGKSTQSLTITVSVVNCKDPNTPQAPVSGVTVKGTLTGPANSNLPVTFTGITQADGKVVFVHSKKVLPAGTYTFTATEPCPFTKSQTK